MKFSIKYKILAGYLFLCFIILLIGISSILNIYSTGGKTFSLYENNALPLVSINDIIKLFNEHRINVFNHITESETENLNMLKEVIDTKFSQIQEKSDNFLKKYKISKENKELFDNCLSRLASYNDITVQIISLSEQNNKKDALYYAMNDEAIIFNEISNYLNIISKNLNKSMQETTINVKNNLIIAPIFIIIGIVISIFTSLMIGIILSNKIGKPLLTIANEAEQISQGQLDIQIIQIKNKDELGFLSNTFNELIKKLREIIINLKNVIIKSKTIGETLSSNTSEVLSTIEEMVSTIKSIFEKINILYQEFQNSNNSIIEINKFIDEVVKLIDEQAASINESSAAIEEMIKSIDNIEKITEIKKDLSDNITSLAIKGQERMKNTVDSIDDISKSTELIFEMIKVINNVAEQTNLLAMNAAIEAAHAGEYGKGFSVVADEIRKLAEATSSKSKDISNSLKTMIEKIKNTTELTKDTNSLINEIIQGIKNVSNSMNEMLTGLKEVTVGSQQITISLGSLNTITEKVKISSADMNNRTKKIGISITHINELVTENKNGISEVNIGINEISKSVISLFELSAQNSENIKILEEEAMKFKT